MHLVCTLLMLISVIFCDLSVNCLFILLFVCSRAANRQKEVHTELPRMDRITSSRCKTLGSRLALKLNVRVLAICWPSPRCPVEVPLAARMATRQQLLVVTVSFLPECTTASQPQSLAIFESQTKSQGIPQGEASLAIFHRKTHRNRNRIVTAIKSPPRILTSLRAPLAIIQCRWPYNETLKTSLRTFLTT